eukprot:1235081-Rhodomonas_salina.1
MSLAVVVFVMLLVLGVCLEVVLRHCSANAMERVRDQQGEGRKQHGDTVRSVFVLPHLRLQPTAIPNANGLV